MLVYAQVRQFLISSRTSSANVLHTELLLHILDERGLKPQGLVLQNPDTTPAGSIDAFLQSKLRFDVDDHGQAICLVDAGGEKVGVMMGWERPISQCESSPSRLPLTGSSVVDETVRLLIEGKDPSLLQVLNCGFGLGIVSELFLPCLSRSWNPSTERLRRSIHCLRIVPVGHQHST